MTISEEKLKTLLDESPAARVSKEYIESRIEKTEYLQVTERLTHCCITLNNGFVVTGESSCVNPENYNQEVGEHYAYQRAFGKLWELFGFLLAEQNHLGICSADEKEAQAKAAEAAKEKEQFAPKEMMTDGGA